MINQYPYWIDVAPNNSDVYSDTVPREIDVLILGGGINALSTAYWIVGRNNNITTLVAEERLPYPNYGLGLMELGNHTDYYSGLVKSADLIHLNEANIVLLDKYLHLTKNSQCQFALHGGLLMARTQEEFLALSQASSEFTKLGIESTILSNDNLIGLIPSNRFEGGLFLPHEASLNPGVFAAELYAKCHDVKVKFYCNSSVLKITGDTARFASGETVKFKYLVHTDGTIYKRVTKNDNVTNYRNHHMATSEFADEELLDIFPNFTISLNGGDDRLRLCGNRIIYSGQRKSVKGEELGVEDKATFNPQVKVNLIKKMGSVFPVLNVLDIDYFWTSIMTQTSDGLPIIDKIDNQFVSLGFGDNELGYNFISGRVIADAILYNGVFQKYKFDVTKYSMKRFGG